MVLAVIEGKGREAVLQERGSTVLPLAQEHMVLFVVWKDGVVLFAARSRGMVTVRSMVLAAVWRGSVVVDRMGVMSTVMKEWRLNVAKNGEGM